MESTITIKSISEKIGKSGKAYIEVETDQGKMTCFTDWDGLPQLKDCWKNDQKARVEITINGTYKNLTKFLGIGEVETINPNEVQTNIALTDPVSHVILNKTEKPNSYEVGKAGNRVKIYFSDSEDLKKQLAELDEIINPGLPPDVVGEAEAQENFTN